MNVVDIYFDGRLCDHVVTYSCGHRARFSDWQVFLQDVVVGRDTLASAKRKMSPCPICLHEALWKAYGSRLDV